ncbi:MAG: hypothetical protein QM715_14420 [Nibricoccus sp.]
MKSITSFIFIFIAAVVLSRPASGETITYFADSQTSFDVQIDGVGAIGISPVSFSPSGFWSFNYQVADVSGFPNVAEIHSLVRREMPAVGPFINPLFAVPTFVAYDELPRVSFGTAGGDMIDGVFTLNSGVALDDWNWTIRLTLRKGSTSVPDGTSTMLLVALAGFALVFARIFGAAHARQHAADVIS